MCEERFFLVYLEEIEVHPLISSDFDGHGLHFSRSPLRYYANSVVWQSSGLAACSGCTLPLTHCTVH